MTTRRRTRALSSAAEGGLSRRGFLKRTAAATASAVAFPLIVPARALGLDGHVAPSERITMAAIGTGSQGTSNLEGFLKLREVQVVAVCDVDRPRRQNAQNMCNETYGSKDCRDYNDFREVLSRDDIDTLSIALPDHWHAIPAIMAANRKFDMYAEKPLSLTIYEGRKMVEAVERNGVVWQTGSWQRSRPEFLQACELVRSGYLGEVHTVEVGLPTGNQCEPQPAMPVPDGFDYDFWLGPAPNAPYTEQRCHWNFRWIFDYSGGQLTDWAAHHCDIANWGMGTEHTGPDSVAGTGEFPTVGLWNTAINYRLECQYGAGKSPVAPQGFKMLVSNGFEMGAKFIGAEGWIHVTRGGIDANPKSLLQIPREQYAQQLYLSTNHAKNFLDCVKSRAATITPIQPAHRAITIAHLGNIAMRLGRPVQWNAETETFDNDPQATRLLKRAMRAPWSIEAIA